MIALKFSLPFTKLWAKQIKELFLVTQRTTLIELPWKKEDGRIQECMSLPSSGTLGATPGFMHEIMDFQPVNKSEILNLCEVMFADDVTLISERTIPSTTNKHLGQHTQLNRQSVGNKPVIRSKDFLWM